MSNFFQSYFNPYLSLIDNNSVQNLLNEYHNAVLQVQKNQATMFFAGNGASASIASHGAVDFTKQAKIKSLTFNESNLITCFSNDYGYENWMSEAVKFYASSNDAITLISVSGESPSVLNAAKKSKELGLKVITFSGRHESNSLKKLGDINFWVDSHAYNIVECIHMIWITSVVDSVVGSSEYEVS